jgi:hypothetical protein
LVTSMFKIVGLQYLGLAFKWVHNLLQTIGISVAAITVSTYTDLVQTS